MNANKLEDESLRELFKASQKLQKCLLNFANYKPNKKNEKAKGNLTASDVVDQGIKDLVDKIVKFNTLYKKQKEIKANQKKHPSSKRISKPKTLHSPSFSNVPKSSLVVKKAVPIKKRPIRKCTKQIASRIKEEENEFPMGNEPQEMKIKIKYPNSPPEVKEENLIGEICSFFSKKNLDKSEYDFNKLKKTIQSLKENRENEMEIMDELKFEPLEEEPTQLNEAQKDYQSYDRLFSGFELSPKNYELNPFMMGTTRASAHKVPLSNFTPRILFTPTPNSAIMQIEGREVMGQQPGDLNKKMDEFVSKLKNNISANSHKLDKKSEHDRINLDSPLPDPSKSRGMLMISPNSTFSFHKRGL